MSSLGRYSSGNLPTQELACPCCASELAPLIPWLAQLSAATCSSTHSSRGWVHSHIAEFRYSVQAIKIGFVSIAVIIQQRENELKGMSCSSLKRPYSLSSSGSQHSMMEPSLPIACSQKSILGSKLYRGCCLDIKG